MTDDNAVNIEATSTRLVYENRWMRVREDTIRRPDGSSGIYGVVEKSDFVVIVPVDDDGRLHLVEQYRYPVKGRYWELPQGSWEQAPGAEPLEMARGELREETGLEPARMIYAGHLFEACGYSNQGFHIFLATGLRRGNADLEREEQDLVTREFTLSEVERMVRDGEIKDATTVAALGLLRLKGLL
ncbi:MAG TPA: NUDIX hydrolase [Candidatus Sulfotelmatobacter sp.]